MQEVVSLETRAHGARMMSGRCKVPIPSYRGCAAGPMFLSLRTQTLFARSAPSTLCSAGSWTGGESDPPDGLQGLRYGADAGRCYGRRNRSDAAQESGSPARARRARLTRRSAGQAPAQASKGKSSITVWTRGARALRTATSDSQRQHPLSRRVGEGAEPVV